MGKASTVAEIETLSCDAGWRGYYFVKLTTSDGVTGWSEYDESFGPAGVTLTINKFAERVVGKSVFEHEKIFADLFATKRMAFSGATAMAAGAIENALLDAKAKTLGVPCYELLGGKIRDKVRVYWSHCAMYRVSRPQYYPPAITDAAGLKAMGAEVKAKGFTALKTNLILHDETGLALSSPGFGRPFQPDLNVERKVLRDLRRTLELMREGAGPDIDIMIDLNFNCRTEGYLKILRAIADLDMFWIEIDMNDPNALAHIRAQSPHPISGGETLFGVRQFLPFLRAQSLDVAIIDAIWNGIWQAMKIAACAEAHEVNIAPHNFYGHLANMMNAHFAAAVPNLRIMEIDIDRIDADAEIFPYPPKIENGYLILPDTPGWGCDPNEKAIRARPFQGDMRR
jgi:L-alanine-DL-glutamate epimerase-like enolase superfamily enzyme